jgi:SAM-dependent methyltransferase
MSLTYRLMYRVGFAPWDNELVPPELVELVEGPRALPPGRALDLGCGRGTHAIYLAQHGWQVTGVDLVPRALETARRKADAAGAQPTFVPGDITRLLELGIGMDYDLLLDVACFHGLTADQRPGATRQITRVARSGAILLLVGFAPAKRGPLPHGIDKDEIVRLFEGEWELLWQRSATDAPLPGPLRNADPSWYCLRKR